MDASFTVRREVTLLGMHPHMHMRGKDMSYRLVFPDVKKRNILNVPHYNGGGSFGTTWQNRLCSPRGSRIQCTAHYDNSAKTRKTLMPARRSPGGSKAPMR